MNFKGIEHKIGLVLVFSIFVGIFIFLFSDIVNAQQGTIIGNSVQLDNANAFIRISPHTITDPQWVYWNMTPKAFTGNIDMIALVDTDNVDFKAIQLYNPHNVISNNSYTCNGDYFNYTLSPKYAWCWENTTSNIGTNSTPVFRSSVTALLFNHMFDVGNIPTKTIYWSTSKTEYYDIFPSQITTQAINWNGLNKAYIAQNLPVVAGMNYQVRVWVEPKFNTAGKYWVAFKPSSETTQQSIINGHIYYIDPWWNTSYRLVQTFQINTTVLSLGGDNVNNGGDGNTNQPCWTVILNTSQVKYSDNANAKWGIDTASLISTKKLDANCDGLRMVNYTNTSVYGYEVGICNNAATPIYACMNNKLTNVNSTDQGIHLFYGDTENQTITPYGSAWANAGVKKSLVVYTFDKNGSTVLNDSTVNRFNATFSNYTNAHVNASGIFGNAFFFSGVGQANNFTIPNDVWNSIMNNLTISFWFKEDGATEGTHNQIVYKGKNGAAGDVQILIAGFQTSCGIFTSSYVEPALAARPSYNQWHYYVCTYDGAAIKEYVDGLLWASAAQTGIVQKSADMAFTVGEDHSGGNRKMRGLIDEFRIDNFSWSADEINASYVNTVNYLVGAEESGGGGSGATTYSTIEFTDRFDYVSMSDAGFTGNWSNGTYTIGSAIHNVQIINNSLWVYTSGGNGGSGHEGSTFITLNTTRGFTNGYLSFDMFNFSDGGDGHRSIGIVFKNMLNLTTFALYLDTESSPDQLVVDVFNNSDYHYNLTTQLSANKVKFNGFDNIGSNNKLNIKILSQVDSMKVFVNDTLYLYIKNSLLTDISNNSISFVAYARPASFANGIGANFDNFVIASEKSPTLSNITNNGTIKSITNFTIVSTDLHTNTSSCILQYATANYTMTRISGTDLFTYTIGSKPVGMNNYQFFCNSTGATNQWTNMTASAIYQDQIVNLPYYSNNQTSFPASYSPTTNTILNISWFGDVINGTAIFQINNVNYSTTYNGSYTNSSLSIILPAGIYNWTSWIIDGNGNGNRTDYYNFMILKATPDIILYLNDSYAQANITSLTYPNATKVNGTIVFQENIVNASLFRNNTLITGMINENLTLSAGFWNYTAYFAGNQNYTANSTQLNLTILKGSLSFNLYLNGTEGNKNLVYPNSTNATLLISPRLNGEGNFSLLRNNTNVSSFVNENRAQDLMSYPANGIYNYSAFAWGFNNYTISNILSGRILTIENDTGVPEFYSFYKSLNINTTNFGNITLKVNVSDTSKISKVRLIYSVNISRNPDYNWIWVNGTAKAVFKSVSSVNETQYGNNWTYNNSLKDSDVYPAIYPIDEDYMETAPNYAYNLYLNNYAEWKVYNFSDKPETFNILELYAAPVATTTNPLIAYYCNASYTGLNFLSSTNCSSIGSIGVTTPYDHSHANRSDYVLNFYTNSSGYIGNVKSTNTSWFVYYSTQSPANKAWKLYYLKNISNSSFTTNNAGTSWVAIDGSFNTHVHQFSNLDYFAYNYEACDAFRTPNCVNSTIQIDYFNLTPVAPSRAGIMIPTIGGNYSGVMNISWGLSNDANGDNFNYSIYLYNNSGNLVLTIANNNITALQYNYSFNTAIYKLNDGNYTLNITAKDNTSLMSSAVLADNFTIDNTKPYFNHFFINSTDIDLDLNNTINIGTRIVDVYPNSLNYTVFQLNYPNGTSVNYTNNYILDSVANTTVLLNYSHASQVGTITVKVYAWDWSGNFNSTTFTKSIQTSKINMTVTLYSNNYTDYNSRFVIANKSQSVSDYFNVTIRMSAFGTANITKVMNISLLPDLLSGQYENFTLSNKTSISQPYGIGNDYINFSMPFNQSQSWTNDLLVHVYNTLNFSTYWQSGYDMYYLNASNVTSTSSFWLYLSMPLNNSYNPSSMNAEITLCTGTIVFNDTFPTCNYTWATPLILSSSNNGMNSINEKILNFQYETSVSNSRFGLNASFTDMLFRVQYISGVSLPSGGSGGSTVTTTTMPLMAVTGVGETEAPLAKLYIWFIGVAVAVWALMEYNTGKKRSQTNNLLEMRI